MTPCRAYLKLGWRYIGPLLCLCWAPHDAMLAPCWAHVTLMLTQFPHLTKFCRSSNTMEKHSILEQKRGPPPPDSHMKLYMKLYWASLGPLLHAYQPMLGPCWPHITPSWSIRHYVRPMLGLCWAHLGPIRHYIGAILGLCWPHVTLMLAHFLQLTNFWHSSKTMEKPSILEQKTPPPQANALPMAKPRL